MSELRVNAVTDETGGNTATINGMTPTAQSLQGFRNRLINSDMRIDQRNAGAAVTLGVGLTYTLDRWQAQSEQASKYSVQRSTVVPAGFTNSLLATSLSAHTIIASDRYIVRQNIEGFNVSDLGWGTANAQSITVSFWVRSSLTGSFGGYVANSAVNRSYPFSYTISAADTWEQKTITIPGDTTGTWLTDSGVGLRLGVGLGVGATYLGTAGAWASGQYLAPTGSVSVVSTNGATFYITGVQLEAGSVATPFERRPYGTELALCQRYAVVYNSNAGNPANRMGFGMASSTTKAFCMIKHPVTMRAKPSLGFSGAVVVSDTTVATVPSSVGIQAITSDVNQTAIDLTFASGLTGFRPYYFEFGSASSTLILSSEL